MISLNLKRINKFAILVIILLVVPEVIGHTLFDKPHSAQSSITGDVSLVNHLHASIGKNVTCHLSMQNDSSGSNVTRAAGLGGKYGEFTCN